MIRPRLLIATVPVAAAVFCFAQGIATHNSPAAPRHAASGRAWPVTFVDVARQAGLAMRFTSGNEQTKKYIIEANGTGVAFLDYDRDGRQDIFLVNGSRFDAVPQEAKPTNHLYHNEGNGRFRDVTLYAGVARSGWGNGVCVGDFNNDGFDDFYVTYWGTNSLYQNDGHGKFVDLATKSGVAGTQKEWSSGCTFLDYDRDGHLDLLVTSYQQFDLATTPPPGKTSNCQWKGMPVFCGPRGLPFGKITLYHNRGDGTFEDVSVKAGVRSIDGFYAFTAVAADFNGDRWTDVYIACDSTPSIFLRNNRNGTFSELGTESGVAFNENGFEQGGMGIAPGDYDNDGQLDMIKTNFAGDHPNVYRNIGKGIFEDVVFKARLAVNPQYVGWGIGLVDLDNDGWKDVFQVNGHVYPELERLGAAERYKNPRLVYRNLSSGIFEDVSAVSGPGVLEPHSSRGAAFGDFNNDGSIDALIMNMGEAPSLLRNDLKSANHWVKVELRGVTSNRSAIGAGITVQAGNLKQTDVVLSQSSYISHNDSRLHFGLGENTSVTEMVVRWPNGAIESFPGAPAENLLLLVEGTAKTQIAPMPK